MLGQVLDGIPLAVDGILIVPGGERGGLVHTAEIESLEVDVALEGDQEAVVVPAPDVLQLVGFPGDGEDAQKACVIVDRL